MGSTDHIPHLYSDVKRAQQLALAVRLPTDVRAAAAGACAWAQLPDAQVFLKALEARDATSAARKALKPYVNAARS